MGHNYVAITFDRGDRTVAHSYFENMNAETTIVDENNDGKIDYIIEEGDQSVPCRDDNRRRIIIIDQAYADASYYTQHRHNCPIKMVETAARSTLAVVLKQFFFNYWKSRARSVIGSFNTFLSDIVYLRDTHNVLFRNSENRGVGVNIVKDNNERLTSIELETYLFNSATESLDVYVYMNEPTLLAQLREIFDTTSDIP